MDKKAVILYFVSFLLLLSCDLRQDQLSPPRADNGIMDLSAWDFDAHPVVNVKGHWGFTWEKFLLPGQTLNKPPKGPPASTIYVPALWNEYQQDGHDIGSKGYGTYEIRLLLPKKIRSYAVHIPEISSSYTLFINGKQIITVGTPTQDIENAGPRIESRVVDFTTNSGMAQLTFHVSNFHQFKGGIRDPVYIGLKADIHKKQIKKISTLYLFFGAILFMGIYHLRLFFIGKNEWTFLFFGLFCLLISTRLLVFEERLIMTFIPDLSINNLFKLEYLTFYLGTGSIIAYLHHLFPNLMNRKIYIGLQTVVLCFSSVVIIFPIFIFTHTLPTFQYFAFGCIAYICFILWKAFLLNLFGIKTFMLGIGSFIAASANDLLNARGIIDTLYLFHVGAFIFLLCQASILIRKYAKAFQIIESQRAGLDEKNSALLLELQKRKDAEHALRAAVKQEKYALVGQVAGKIAHDFNNILGAIMGSSELAIEDCREEETRQILKMINDQTQRGKNLTRNLVAFAKDQEPKQEFFNIEKKITLMLNLLKKDLEDITITREAQEDTPDIFADPGMVEHTLINLLQNAIHATSLMEEKKIVIRTYTDEKNIFLEVTDNGCGIPEKYIEKIYEPSFTLKGSRDKDGVYRPGIKGTGYGLSNVNKYVEQHYGTISVQSQVNAGTTVGISLPVIKKELTVQEKSQISHEKPVTHKRILLVEDEPTISEVQHRILTDSPCCHTVDVAGDGKEAMALLDTHIYDFISLDFVLPGQINGMDIYAYIRKKNRAVPILFISGNLEFLESTRDLELKDPFLEHMPKPFGNKAYISRINQLFKKTLNN